MKETVPEKEEVNIPSIDRVRPGRLLKGFELCDGREGCLGEWLLVCWGLVSVEEANASEH